MYIYAASPYKNLDQQIRLTETWLKHSDKLENEIYRIWSENYTIAKNSIFDMDLYIMACWVLDPTNLEALTASVRNPLLETLLWGKGNLEVYPEYIAAYIPKGKYETFDEIWKATEIFERKTISKLDLIMDES